MNWRNGVALGVLGVGLLQMVGYLLGSPVLRGVGAASGVAPFPKVFCEADGYEGFAATFRLIGRYPDGQGWELALSPEVCSRLRGPYNRRNVYGAALAYAPRLPEGLRQALLLETLTPGAQMRVELGVPPEVGALEIEITPRPGEAGGPYHYGVSSP